MNRQLMDFNGENYSVARKLQPGSTGNWSIVGAVITKIDTNLLAVIYWSEGRV